jgi:hypothetical protein
MSNYNKFMTRALPLVLLLAAVWYFSCRDNYGGYGSEKYQGAPVSTVIDGRAARVNDSAVGLASSLLPREVSTAEDFGQFAPDDILKGQNFLDPRAQIGFPETIGGNIRNANQSIRSEPPNPKQAYVWQNSTITPDLMRRSVD